MKIGYLITKPGLGGAQSHVLSLIDALRKKHHVVLATGNEGWLTEQARSLHVPVTCIRSLENPVHPLRDARACREIKDWLREERPDILHVHSSKAGVLGRIASRAVGIPTVFTVHGWAFAGGTTWKRKFLAGPSEWIAARLGGDIICVSQYDYDLALKYHVASRAKLNRIWNGLADVGARAAPGSTVTPLIIMVARFSIQKDHATLLRALSKIGDLRWRLLLVGDGPLLEHTQALASELGLDERIEFMAARTDIPELLAKAHVYVLATKFEGLPISILEAMRAGLPVVASSVGGVSELVDEKSGILVPRRNVTALAEALRTLLGNPDLAAGMGAAGRSRYERDFRSDAMIGETVGVYLNNVAQEHTIASSLRE